MTNTMKALAFATFLGFITVVILAGLARAETDTEHETRLAASLDCAMRAVFYGVEANFVRVNGHQFHVESAHFAHSGSLTIIKGQLAHCQPGRKDEFVHYTIRKSGPIVVSADMIVDRGSVAGWTSRIAKYVLGISIGDDELVSASRRLGRLTDGNWETTAELIVTSVALRADRFGRDRLAIHRASLSRPTQGAADVDGQPVGAVNVPRSDRAASDRG